MPAEAQSNTDATAPFGSLFELRRAHSELMLLVRDRAHISELTQRIRDFLARAAATGAVLRASDEREAAQNILDYWNASLLTMRGVDRSSFTTVQLEPVDASLAPDLSNKPNPYIGLSVFDETKRRSVLWPGGGVTDLTRKNQTASNRFHYRPNRQR
jgi:hypothetical protein